MTLSRDTGLGLLALALAGGYYAGATQIQASLLADAVGADGVPKVLAVGMGLVGAALVLRGQWRPAPADDEAVSTSHHLRALALLGILVAYLLAIPWLGYPIAVAMLLAVVSWFAGTRPGLAWAATAIVGAGLFWLMFTRLLGIPMPTGFF